MLDAEPWRDAPRSFTHAVLADAHAQVLLAGGDAAGAVDLALRAGEDLRTLRAATPVVVAWRSTAALALAARGEQARAAALADEELALTRAFGTPRAIGIALRAKGLVSADVDALRAAARTLAGADARLEHARALCDLGAALRRANRRADARGPLQRALEQAEQGGMRLLARRAREKLNAAGARPRRSALSGPGALTPAEHRVAALAAAGHGNRTIAERLYITQRTVETHLTHAFGKLQITARTQLASALKPEGRTAHAALAR
jgi:DNA-binding NarL/FixJ family response regulator